MAQRKLGRSRNGEQQRFSEWPPRVLHYPTRICRRLPVLTSGLTFRSEPCATGYVKNLVKLQAAAAADDFFMISVVLPKIDCMG
jgi:hypothetical protein